MEKSIREKKEKTPLGSLRRTDADPGSHTLDVERIRKQIREFAKVWEIKRLKSSQCSPRITPGTGGDEMLDWAADELTSKFLNYIDAHK